MEFSKGIRGKEIYPMACSTAARTGMKIVRSSSFPTSLQFMCCQALRNAIPHSRDVTEAVNIAPGLKLFLLNNLDWLLRPHNPEQINEGVCSLRKRGSMKCAQDLLAGDDAVDASESLKPTQPSERSPSEYLPPRKRRCFSDSQASTLYNRLDDSDDNTLL